LKSQGGHFPKLFDKHNDIDQKIKNIEAGIESAADEEIENLKKEKLRLKDELYAMLKKFSA
jgi:uncharacterized protein YdcH (DUF465 family)